MVSVGQAYAAENRERNRKLNERLEKCFSETWKVIFAGDHGVGKSNIFLRFTCNQFSKEKYGYFGMEYRSRWIQHNNKKIKIGFWDTGGQERFGALGIRGADGAFLVYDIANRASFEHVEKWLQEIRKNNSYGDSDPIILLVGSKTDLESTRKVTTEEAERFAEANALLHIEVSALGATNINDAFQLLVGEILQRRFQCAKEEIEFRDTHELWATVDSETNISILKGIAMLSLHPDFIIVFAFLVCILLYVFYT